MHIYLCMSIYIYIFYIDTYIMIYMRHVYDIYNHLASYVHHVAHIMAHTKIPWSPGTDHQISSLVPHNFQLTSQTSFNPLLDTVTKRGAMGRAKKQLPKIEIQQK